MGGDNHEKDKFDQIIGKCRSPTFRDVYHVNEKIKQRLCFDKPMEKKMRQAVRAYDWNRIETVVSLQRKVGLRITMTKHLNIKKIS